MMQSIVSRVMISFRFGPAFTWQCTQVRLPKLAHVDLKNLGASATKGD
jgi:hypothetical protein